MRDEKRIEAIQTLLSDHHAQTKRIAEEQEMLESGISFCNERGELPLTVKVYFGTSSYARMVSFALVEFMKDNECALLKKINEELEHYRVNREEDIVALLKELQEQLEVKKPEEKKEKEKK